MQVENSPAFEWRNVLHPVIEAIHLVGFALCLWLALIAWKVLPAPAAFGMEGYPRSAEAGVITFVVAIVVLEYFAGFFVAKTLLNKSLPQNEPALADRRKRVFGARLGWAISSLIFAFFSYTLLLGISQSAAGFDVNRRWPMEQGESS